MLKSYATLVKEEVVDKTYLKLCQNKTHMGPISEAKVNRNRATNLSAAANKIRVKADFTVSFKGSDPEKSGDGQNNMNRSWILVFDNDNDIEVAKEALLLEQAWSLVHPDEGTPEYMDKLKAMLQARSQAYETLGINPGSTGKKRPSLTHEQRAVYNQMVGPYGFDYYEYHLAFKLAGEKGFVRTTTYRTLRPVDPRNLLGRIKAKAEQISKDIEINVKKAN